MERDKDHWVYALTEPFTHEIRYVGCTNDPLERLRSHLWSQNPHNPDLVAWIKKNARRGCCPGLMILEQVKDYMSRGDRERFWVEKFHAEGRSLFNKVLKPGYMKPETGAIAKSIAAQVRVICDRIGWDASVEDIERELGPQKHCFGNVNTVVRNGVRYAVANKKPYPVPLAYIRDIRNRGPRTSNARMIEGT